MLLIAVSFAFVIEPRLGYVSGSDVNGASNLGDSFNLIVRGNNELHLKSFLNNSQA